MFLCTSLSCVFMALLFVRARIYAPQVSVLNNVHNSVTVSDPVVSLRHETKPTASSQDWETRRSLFSWFLIDSATTNMTPLL